jgi:hypothetical protein
MRFSRARYIWLFLAPFLPLAAAAAPMPIHGPMVISQSGEYVVTQDFTSFFQPAIKLTGTVDVTINLAGHTISAYAAPVVQVRAFKDDDGCRTLRIWNGHVLGGYGLSAMSNGSGGCSPQVMIDGMSFENADVYVEDAALVVTSSVVMHGGIASVASAVSNPATLRGNRVFGGDIALLGIDGGRILGNVVRGGSIMVRGTGTIVASNMIGGDVEVGGDASGQGAQNVQVAKNRIMGSVSLTQTGGSSITGNGILGCGSTGSAVRVDFGTGNHIDGNAFQGGCEHGITFDELSSGNEYSANTYRIYTAEPIVDDGTDNVNGSVREILPEPE